VAYSKQRPQVHPFYWGREWDRGMKGRFLEADRLHLSEPGYTELGKQVRGRAAGRARAAPPSANAEAASRPWREPPG
jgi:hypothetical protein